MAFGFFDPQKGQSATGIAQSRAMAAALLRSGGAPRNVGEGLNAIGDAIFYRSLIGNADASEKAGTDAFNSTFNSLIAPYSGGQASTVPMPTAAGEVAATAPGSVTNTGVLPGSLLAALDKTEGGGGYDTLFGNAQRKGPFAGTDVSKMSIADVLAFQDPNGPYAQTVKGQVGRVATPVGRHQIVGTTLRNAVGALGLDLSQPFDPATQDQVALYLAKNRVNASDNLAGQMAGLRSEWAGFKNIPDAQLAQIIGDLKGGVQTAPVGNVEVASLAAPQTATDAINTVAPQAGYRDPMVTTAYANPAPSTAAAPPLPAPTTVAPAPSVAETAPLPVAAPQQVAQNFQPQQIDPRLIEAANSPFATPGQKAILGGIIQQQQARNELLLKQQMQQADPSYQMGLEKNRLEIEKLRRGDKRPTQVVDKRLLQQQDDGSWVDVTPASAGGTAEEPAFGGNSAEVQAANYNVANGIWTKEQAANYLGGKTIVDPATGAQSFFPANVLVSGQQSNVAPQQNGYVDLFGTQPAPATSSQQLPNVAPSTAAPQQPTGIAPGAITLTGGRPDKLTEAQERNKSLWFNTKADYPTAIDNFDALSDPTNQALAKLPLSDYLTTPQYQQAFNAVKNIIGNSIYSTSGASAPVEEVENQARLLMPRPGESKESLADKKRRIRDKVNSIGRAGSIQDKDLFGEQETSQSAAKSPKPRAKNYSTGEVKEWNGKEWVTVNE